MSLETWWLELIEGRRGPQFLRSFLAILSYGYRAGINLRHGAYNHRLFRTTTLPTCVISIGNIHVGGSGKTPFTCYLAKRLMPFGKVAILTRGYRSQIERENRIHQVTLADDPASYGDEACYLARELPNALVMAGKDRVAAGRKALEVGAQMILLDDGFQHRRLGRQFDLVMMASDQLLSKSYFLPRGRLRDTPKRLKTASLILISGIEDESQFVTWQKELAPFTDAPIVGLASHFPNAAELKGRKALAFCGLGNPNRFFQSLEKLSCQLVAKETWPDHYAFSPQELKSLDEKAVSLGADCLVCTEKEAIKCPKNQNLTLPLIPLRLEVEPRYNRQVLESIIEKIREEIL